MLEKLIGLIDCDSFFVSCEQAVDPRLKGLPVVVTTGERGCVVSRSKEAKAVGVKMGVPVFMDRKEHSGIIYIQAHRALYTETSKRVMSIIKNYSPVVEVSSIDEAYIDLTGTERLYKSSPEGIARMIRDEIRQKTDIPVSVGISSTKTLAKLACDKSKKANGILYVGEAARRELLRHTPIEEICGIGKSGAKTLKMTGIFTAAELAEAPDGLLKKAAGKNGLSIKYELSGISVRPVEAAERQPKSIQDTAALSDFSRDKATLKEALSGHAREACRRLRRHNGYCAVVSVMLRTKDFRIFETRTRLPFATNAEEDVIKAALSLLNELFDPRTTYRSVGIMLENLDYGNQSDLFQKTLHRDSPLDRAIDELEAKFGTRIIKRNNL